MAPKIICVIGAGMCGLTSVKACLEENLNVICYEKTNSVGGLWKYRNATIDSVGSVMQSTLMNSSKEMTCFSDFPPPEHFPNYYPQSTMAEYLQMYAEKFKLVQHVQLETEVITVKRSCDYNSTGKWSVTVKTKENKIVEKVFHGVMVCTGHHGHPYIPEFNSLQNFKGNIYHTRDVKNSELFKDKRVLVIGIGNSGGDVAVEASRVAKQVFVSVRSGSWVCSRLAEGGTPLDARFTTRIFSYIIYYTAFHFLNMIAEARVNLRFDHELYCLKPKYGFFNQHIMINDELPIRVVSGSIRIVDDVLRFTDTGVVFNNRNNVEEPVDVIILATGYNIHYPFLEENILELKDHCPILYKYAFPPQLPHSTLAFVGLLQVQGALTPLAEIQARWITKIFQGSHTLPMKETMMVDIERKQWELRQRFVASRRHSIQVDYIWYQDEIAHLIGVKPDFRVMAFTDPILFYACFFGPNYPYIYRLTGSNSWKGARKTILQGKKRMVIPLKTRVVPESSKSSMLENLYVAPVITILIAILATALLICF